MNLSHDTARTGNVSMKAKLRNDHGACLAEFMMSLTIGAIVLAASLQTFNVLHAQTSRQQRAMSHQQDLRLGLEVLEQEVRLATAESIVTASERELFFLANINGQRTTLTTTVIPGQSVLPVLDGSGWGKGKMVRLCGKQVCESHALVRDGQRQQLTLTEPVGVMFAQGASVEVTNRVSYYAKPDSGGVLRLMRMIDGGANALIGDLKDVRFSYWDEHGHPAQGPSMTKRVVVEMTSRVSAQRTIREVTLRS
jgi:hypothetical protein